MCMESVFVKMMELLSSSPFENILWVLFWMVPCGWCFVELVFWWYIYRCRWISRCNQKQLLPPHPYHRHPNVQERHCLLNRIATCILENAMTTTTNNTTELAQQPSCGSSRSQQQQIIQACVTQFLTNWFQPKATTTSTRKQLPVSGAPTALCSNHNFSTNPTTTKTIAPTNNVKESMEPTAAPSTSSMVQQFFFKSISAVSDRSTATTALSSETESVTSSSNASPSEQEEEEDGTTQQHSSDRSPEMVPWSVPGISKESMDSFLAWALFAKDMADMSPIEIEELDRCYQVLYEKLYLTFPTNHHHAKAEEDAESDHDKQDRRDRSTNPPVIELEPRRMSLEDVSPWHRPLALYILVMVGYYLAGLILRIAGFQRVVSANGVVGWFRPGSVQNHLPLLFFHGIAPAGILFYIPFVLMGILSNKDYRPCFLFENPNISCRIQFDALDEQQTVNGVQEIVETCLKEYSGPLSLCGHSFGSCQLTWMLIYSKPEFRRRIRQFVLLDPVTILLYEPDVLKNFLYSRGMSKIRLVAGSELFVEYFLRRHFAWYNSELGLEELLLPTQECHGNTNGHSTAMANPPIHAIIALSERDEIVNAPKVLNYMERFVRTNKSSVGTRLRSIYWPNARHAACVTSIRKWRDVNIQMLESELDIIRSTYVDEGKQT